MRISYNFFKAFVFCLVGSIVSSAFVFADPKIAFVDNLQVMQESKPGKAILDKLKVKYEKKQKEFETKQAELQKEGEDLTKQQSVLSKEGFQKKQAELQQKVIQFQEAVTKEQTQLNEQKEKELKSLETKMERVVKNVAAAGRYDMILNKYDFLGRQIVLWVDSKDRDLTEEVIKQLNTAGGK